MKVLITTDCYTPTVNGVVTSVKNLKHELTKRGHEVRILTLSNSMQSREKDGILYLGSLNAGKIYPGARLSISRDNKYIDEILEWGPEIVHSQSEFSTFSIARKISSKLHVPLIHTYHTVYEDYTHYFSPVEKWGKTMATLFTRVTLKHTNCVIAPTDKVFSLLKGYGIVQDTKVIPTGIDLNRFKTAITEKEKDTLREALGIPKGNKVLMTVGRLAKEKNIEEILRFISKTGNMKLTLVVVGDGPHKEFLIRFSEQLGLGDRIVFTGMVPPTKVSAFYQLGDVFVCASNSETQGLTYIEAMANGVPILCRKDDCLADVIIEGVNGWQYETFQQFKTKLTQVLANPPDEDGKKRIVSSVHRFSSTKFGLEMERLYKDAIDASMQNQPAYQLEALRYAD
ncbi:MAG: glycosyltransferase [Lentihominibacter sp.]|jgi:1,2-diacylglycerol 3-alpha-glucosyltransferase